ncbi:MAG: mechanosensitive ion channel protein MscS [Alphaproteobacteria bacterium]|nr:MAG: mechanosensitive ion channel protein MscS [Alphaproteobacteria bacterium]
MTIKRTAAALAVWLWLAVAAIAWMPAVASAQDAAPPREQAPAQAQSVEGWSRVLDGLQQALNREGVTDAELARISEEAGRISHQAAALVGRLSPGVREIQQQIDQLGPAPANGDAPEGEAVAARRKALQAALAAADGPLREARLTIVRADQINSAALSKRRDRFVRSLTERSRSILDPVLWRDGTAGLPRFLRSLRLVLTESATASAQRIAATPAALLLLLAQIGAGLAVAWYVARRIARHFDGLPPAVAGEAGADGSGARHLGDFLRGGVLPALLLLFAARMVSGSSLLGVRIDRLMTNSVYALCVVVVALALLRVFARPARRELRIADLTDAAARNLMSVVTAGLVLAGTLHVLGVAAVLLQAPFEISLALSGLFALVCILATARALLLVAYGGPEDDIDAAPVARLIRWQYVRWLLWLGVVVAVGALLFGFIALAEFVAYQIIIGLIVIGMLWLVMAWIDEARQAALDPDRSVYMWAARATGIGASSARQIAVLGFGLLRVVVVIAAIMALLLPWGVRTADWLVFVNRAFFGFQIGELTISFSAILTALTLFVIGIIATRTVQQWVANQYLPTTNLDTGLRNSITTVLGYVGFVLAALLAIGSAGLDLTNIALVAGALSVGIGLGLQSIVNNFVSGLILLAERPIKAGDWIITSAGEGTVRRISVRSTEIETFDRATVIVPNSTLITDSLTNWTHRTKLGRIGVRVGVGYESDPDEVRAILLACAADHPTILQRPEPAVFFMDFGADALIFELRAWVGDIGLGFGVRSDLRFDILRRLRAAGIAIPFPQRDLHIRSGLEALAGRVRAAGDKAAKGAPTASGARRRRGREGS